MNKLRILLCNLLWLATCLPGYFAFKRALSNPKRCQTNILRTLLRKNQDSHYGQRHHFGTITNWEQFQALPLTNTDDYEDAIQQIMAGAKHVLTRDPVEILQPTSGTSSSPRLIPHNKSMATEFRKGLDTWIADLFLRYSGLLLGSQYWSISPATQQKQPTKSAVSVGFLDDIEYFGKKRRWLMRQILVVPPEVQRIPNIDANHYVTMLFLLRAKHLRLISVWHPSFLTNLLETMKSNWKQCLSDIRNGGIDAGISLPADLRETLTSQLKPDPRRYEELQSIDFAPADACRHIWPRMQIISCWSESNAAAGTLAIRDSFPSARVQAKGLLATEGIVTIPFGPEQKHVCAVTSHVLEFLDDHGEVHPLWDLSLGDKYQVVLTTAGGLYRYQLGDRVKVTGYIAKTPCLRFLGRAGVVSDCVGEKVHLEHVEAILEDIRKKHDLFGQFMMVVPSSKTGINRYHLLLEGRPDREPELKEIAGMLEHLLCSNYHYKHARNLRQLDSAEVTLVAETANRKYQELMISRGATAATVKCPALCTTPDIDRQLVGAIWEEKYA